MSGFDWKAWRRGKRAALIAARKTLAPEDRASRNAAIARWLEAGFAALGGLTVGFCWRFAAEPEPRFAVERWRQAGSRAALPVVVAPRTPLEFRAWWPGVPMQAGVYGIPFPVGTEVVALDAALIPVNGFDAGGYRLGYGGGYFDRTLAEYPVKPICIGLGYEIARLDTIHPQPHDVPLDFVVTEAGIYGRFDGTLLALDPDKARRRLDTLLPERFSGEVTPPSQP